MPLTQLTGAEAYVVRKLQSSQWRRPELSDRDRLRQRGFVLKRTAIRRGK